MDNKRPLEPEPDPADQPSKQAKTTGRAQRSITAVVSSDKGSRQTMEDVHCIIDDPEKGILFFGVFDGHGGSHVAELACEQLYEQSRALGLQQVYEEHTSSSEPLPKLNIKAAKQAIIDAFHKTDELCLAAAGKHDWCDGACAVGFWLLGSTGIVANIGDAKCVLARGTDKVQSGSNKQAGALTNKALTLTKDHLAIYPSERTRIEKAGGFVSDGRLQGRMQVARSFGDLQLKKFGCSSTPDLAAFQVGEKDAFVILACDGFWSVFDASSAVEMAAELLSSGRDAKSVANRLLNEAVRERKCKDNVTIVLVLFNDR